jgi:hypothetical protein
METSTLEQRVKRLEEIEGIAKTVDNKKLPFIKETGRAQWIGDQLHIIWGRKEKSVLFMYKEGNKYILSSGDRGSAVSPSLGGELNGIPYTTNEEAAKITLGVYYSHWNSGTELIK